jgi:hypothetical protein
MCVRALLSSTENNVCFSEFVSLSFPFLIFFNFPCFDGSSGEGECQKPPPNLSEGVFDLIHSTPAT